MDIETFNSVYKGQVELVCYFDKRGRTHYGGINRLHSALRNGDMDIMVLQYTRDAKGTPKTGQRRVRTVTGYKFGDDGFFSLERRSKEWWRVVGCVHYVK